MAPFYVIRVTLPEGDVLYWRSMSRPGTPCIGEATVFRESSAAGDVRSVIQEWTTGLVEIVAVNPETITREE